MFPEIDKENQPIERPVRVLRVIARLNMGGPAKHVGLLSGRRMERLGYETLLIHGSLAPGEEALTEVAEDEGANMKYIRELAPPIRPDLDARALLSLIGVVRNFRPDIIHTHTAKAGFLGRAAALSVRPRPVVVHTYHGHVLEGYFGTTKTSVYRGLERSAARVSDRLVGVSQATVDDLVRLGVAPADKFRVVPLGLNLDSYQELELMPDKVARRELGIDVEGLLFVYVGRIAPIKRLDVLLKSLALAREEGDQIQLAIVGDGEQREDLQGLARGLGIESSVHFLGYRTDLDRVMAAADAVVLSSDNEGTPVSLIEAAASGRPVVATDVGGVRDVVTDKTGIVVAPDDPKALAGGMVTLARDLDMRRDLGGHARAHSVSHYSAGRLIRDIDSLYSELLGKQLQQDASPTEGVPENTSGQSEVN